MATTTNKTNKPPMPPKGNQTFLFDKTNYIWMLAGVALILLGFVLMAGGKNEDPNQFNYNEIYSVRRITIAPLLILLGFGIEIYAIMKKPRQTDGNDATIK